VVAGSVARVALAFAAVWALAGHAADAGPTSTSRAGETLTQSLTEFSALQVSTESRDQLAQLERAVAAGARSGSDYVVLPEFAAATWRAEAPRLAARLAELAQRHRVHIAASVPVAAGDRRSYTVAATLWSRDGQVRLARRKLMPGAHDMPDFVRGDPWTLLEGWDDGRGFRVGVLAGDDIMSDVPRLSERGAQVVLVSAAWSSADAPRWRSICAELSRRYKITLVVAGAAGQGAAIYAPTGTPEPSAPGAPRVSVALTPREPSVPTALGLPSVPVPSEYEVTPQLVELGRELFFDASLSRNGAVSCASCHKPELAFSNGEATGAGVDGQRKTRNVSSLLNVAYKGALFWDGASSSLESQAKFPMTHAAEMNLHYLDSVARVRAKTNYAERFRAMLGREPEFLDIARALASYERTLIAGESAFDRHVYGGEEAALTASARRGLQLFKGKAGCASCHSLGADSALFTDQRFHNTGVGYDGETFADLGLGALTDARNVGLFLTPSLRNVALTAPYMHDGSLATLEAVVAFYDQGGIANPGLDPAIRPLQLTGMERGDLVAFLRALTSGTTYTRDGRRVEPHSAAARTAQATLFAAIDFRPELAEVERNRDALAPLVRRAAAAQARLVVLPEHALTGEPSALGLDRDGAERMAVRTRDAAESLMRLARELRVWLTLPVLEVDASSPTYYVTTLLVDAEGHQVATHRKVDPRREFGDGSATGGRGNTLAAIPTPFGTLGLLSGDEIDGGLGRLAAHGAATILVGASWSTRDAKDWPGLATAAARRLRVNLVIGNLLPTGTASIGGRVIDAGGVTLDQEREARDGGAIVYGSLERTVAHGSAPLGLPPAPLPVDRDTTRASIELGERLFFEPRLSRTGELSCATCHEPRQAFTDGRVVARGVAGRLGTRNTPSILNAVYRPLFAWDGVTVSIEQQILRALHSWHEMDMDVDERAPALEQDADYRQRFRALTGREGVRQADVAAVIADYVRSLLAGDSAFDRYYYAGDERALSSDARAGLALFAGKAGCNRCHALTSTHALFSDHQFHNTGVGYHERFEYLGYSGDGLELNLARKNDFRGEYLTPSLRNVALTAPYMHDGSLATLDDVVRFYDRGGVRNPFLDPRLAPLGLSADEHRQLVAFLRALTSEQRPEPVSPADVHPTLAARTP
jgi:cytochrome c peroxidase